MSEPRTDNDSPPDKQTGRNRRWLLLLVFLACLLPVGLQVSYTFMTGPESDQDQVVIFIPKGSSVARIGEILGGAGLIHADFRFQLLARLTGLGGRLQAGEFSLPTEKSPLEILRLLATARPVLHPITIPEGYTAADIGRLFGEQGWCDPRSFLNLVEDRTLAQTLGLGDVASLEGYLFPDTYYLTRDQRGAKGLIVMMVDRFHQVWNELTDEDDYPFDRHNIVILASIIEKETANPAERELISSVFHNRLRVGMRLQSDPTVLYGRKRDSGPITRKDLRTATPYNTYTIAGLPAGPICNPGRAALYAAMYPAASDSLYFVSKNDGSHHFSRTLREHNRAVRKYQRK